MWKKITGWGAVRAEKWFTSFISDEDKDDIIEIAKSIQNSGLLFDGATETAKHELEKQVGFLVLWRQLWLLHWQPVVSSLINAIFGKGVIESRKRTRRLISSIINISLMI